MKYLALAAMLAVSATAIAQDDLDPSTLSVDLGTDEDGGSSIYLDANLTLPANARFALAVGETRTPGDTPDITTRSYLIGVGSDPLAPFSAGVEFEHWGDEGDLVSDTWRLNLGLNGEHWALSVRPQQRNLTLYTDPVIPCPACPSSVEVESTAIAVNAAYYSDGPWSFNAGYMEHDYDRDISGLSRYPRLMQAVFSPSTINLTNSFQDYQVSLGLSYYAGAWGTLSYDWLKSVSAVDEAVTYVNTLSFSKQLTEQWRLRLSAGWQVDDATDASLVFGGVGLAYSW